MKRFLVKASCLDPLLHPPIGSPHDAETASVDGTDAPEDHAPTGSRNDIEGGTVTPTVNEPFAPYRGILGSVRQEGVNRFVLMKNPNFENCNF